MYRGLRLTQSGLWSSIGGYYVFTLDSGQVFILVDELGIMKILTHKLNLILKVKINLPPPPKKKKNNRDPNQVVLHLWSKFGDPSLNRWWVIMWTSLIWTHRHRQPFLTLIYKPLVKLKLSYQQYIFVANDDKVGIVKTHGFKWCNNMFYCKEAEN